MGMPKVRIRRWRRVEYEKMITKGIFSPDDRLELLDGLLVVREPQGSGHATAVLLAQASLQRVFGRRYHVRPQLPVALDEMSEPEPDLVVVHGRPRDYRKAHPARPVLVLEIAETSLAIDRQRKGRLYARAAINDYWILNLEDRVLEVYREPGRPPGARYEAYRSVRLLRPGAAVTPLALPRARIRVSDLLP